MSCSASNSSLDDLPFEVYELIVSTLDFPSLKSFRLVNHKCKTIATPHVFRVVRFRCVEASYQRALLIGSSAHLKNYVETFEVHRSLVDAGLLTRSVPLKKRHYTKTLMEDYMEHMLHDARRYFIGFNFSASRLQEDLKRLVELFPNIKELRDIPDTFNEHDLYRDLCNEVFDCLQDDIRLLRCYDGTGCNFDPKISTALMQAYGSAAIRNDQIKHLWIDFITNDEVDWFLEKLQSKQLAAEYRGMRERFQHLTYITLNDRSPFPKDDREKATWSAEQKEIVRRAASALEALDCLDEQYPEQSRSEKFIL